MEIKKKLILIIEFLVIIGAGVSLLFYYTISKSFIEERVGNHHESVAVIKEKQILNIIEENKNDIETWSSEIASLLASASGDSYKTVKKIFNDKLASEDVLNDLFVVNNEGKIIISNKEDEEGKFVTFEPYFIEGSKRTYVQGFYQDIILSAPAVTISSPIKLNGLTIGVFAGRVDLSVFSRILNERSGLGLSGETYLVNSINLLVTDTLFFKGNRFEKFFYSEDMSHCLMGNGGRHNKNYIGEDVIGTHKFLQDIQACLVVDEGADEAYAPIYNLRLISLIIIIILSIISLPIIFVVSSSLSGPINKLKKYAENISSGNLDVKLDIRTGDELEKLADSFENMADSLKHSRIVLEDRVEERTKEINSKLKEIENMNKMMIGRELKMIELKKENQKLKEEIEGLKK